MQLIRIIGLVFFVLFGYYFIPSTRTSATKKPNKFHCQIVNTLQQANQIASDLTFENTNEDDEDYSKSIAVQKHLILISTYQNSKFFFSKTNFTFSKNILHNLLDLPPPYRA